MSNILVLVVVGGIGVVGIALGVIALMGHLRVRDTDPTDIADIDPGMGEVELVGTARPVEEPFESPITKRQAMAYTWSVRSYKRHSTAEGSPWDTVEIGKDKQRFILDDGTGKILIDPEAAIMDLDEKTWEIDEGENPPEVIRRYLEESDSSDPAVSEVVYKRTRKFFEGRLSPGGDVYVYGPVVAGPAEEAPSGTVTPYIGSDKLMEEQDGSGGGFLSSLMGMTDTFTFSNTGEKEAQQTLLTQAAVFGGIGLFCIAIAVAVAFL